MGEGPRHHPGSLNCIPCHSLGPGRQVDLSLSLKRRVVGGFELLLLQPSLVLALLGSWGWRPPGVLWAQLRRPAFLPLAPRKVLVSLPWGICGTFHGCFYRSSLRPRGAKGWPGVRSVWGGGDA